MTTPVDICNRALQQIGSQSSIASLADTSPEAIACNTLYLSVVYMLLRDLSPEFAHLFATLAASSNPAPSPWALEYVYPVDCLRLLQVFPANPDKNDPQPVRWSVIPAVVAGIPGKAIVTNQTAAHAFYVTNFSNEDQWDAMFTEAVVRVLASELSMAIGGRPDLSKQKLSEGGQIAQVSVGRDS